MAGSLQDQLLKAGLADADKAKKLDKEKRKQAKVARRAGVDIVDENKEAARKAREEQAQRDRELNQALNSKAQRKAINAQIKQLIDSNKLEKGRGDIGFNFTDGKKVKKLYVTAMEQKQRLPGALGRVVDVEAVGRDGRALHGPMVARRPPVARRRGPGPVHAPGRKRVGAPDRFA